MKKIFLLALLIICGFLFTGCSNKTLNTWEEIEKRGYVIVGLDDTFTPMGFRDNNGNIVGFDVDLAKEVFSRLNIEVRFQPIDWDAKVLELNSGNIDMIWNGLTITDERKKEMSFSFPYLGNSQMIMVKKGSTISKISDLTGKKVGVQISSASEKIVVENSIYPSITLLKFDNFSLALSELRNSTVDAVVIDEIMGRYIMSLQPDIYQEASENFGVEEYGIGFRLKATDVRDKVNEVLIDMIEDEKASEISIRWFDEDIFLRP